MSLRVIFFSTIQIVCLLFSTLVVMIGISHSQVTSPPLLDGYRISQLEKALIEIKSEHTLLAYLLFGNLVAVIASLVTYIVQQRKKQ